MTDKEVDLVMRKLWLTYYNNTLYEKGVISERTFIQMQNEIKSLK